MIDPQELERLAVEAGMETRLNIGLASMVYSKDCSGVMQGHLARFAELVLLSAQPKKPAFNAAEMPLPQWLPRGAWVEWCKSRQEIRKPLKKRGAVMQIAQLHDYMAVGHRPEDVIKNSIAGGYQGLFPGRKQQAQDWRDEQRQRVESAVPGIAATMARRAVNDYYPDIDARDSLQRLADSRAEP